MDGPLAPALSYSQGAAISRSAAAVARGGGKVDKDVR